MSTEVLRTIGRSTVLSVGLAILTPAAFAADVDFRPALSFGLFHSGNVLLIGYDPATGQPASAVSDDLAALAADLEVNRATADSNFWFLYRPAYVRYHQRTDLDFLSNSIAIAYTKQRARRGGFFVNLDAARSDSQSLTAQTADRPNTIVPRTTITRVHAAVGGSEAVGKRSLLDWDVHGSDARYDAVPGVVLNNNNSVGVRGGWRFEYSQRGTIGLAVVLDRFGFDLSPTVVDVSAVLTGTYSVGRASNIRYDLGVTRATSESVSSTNGVFNLTYSRRVSQFSYLDTGATQTYSSGSGLQGSSRDTGAWISYRREPERRGLNGGVNASYWYRSLLAFAGGTAGQTSTLVFDGVLGWTINRFLALNGVASYTKQSARNGAPGALDADYASYGVVLRWAILGRQSSAGMGALNVLPSPGGQP